MFTQSPLQRVVYILLCLLPVACTGPYQATISTVTKKEHPPGQGIYKVGEPYQINGVWYYPHEDYNYCETGVASWYGIGFHGRETANGEVFDMNALTAAHRTLPIPSVVRVTNLTNGHILVVRVNDRGPFVNERIIDLSSQAAHLLGFNTQGIAQVKVEVLVEESLALKSQLLRNSLIAEGPKKVKVDSSRIAVTSESSLGLLQQALDTPHSSPEITAATFTITPTQKLTGNPIAFDKPSYYIQAATFSNSTLAYQASKQLKEIGSINLAPQFHGGRTLYRLRLGPLAERLAAEQLLALIRKSGYIDAWIIMEE